MAGLPCEACQEGLMVLPTGTIVTDSAGRVLYRRVCTCTNPKCELYLIRRVSYEAVAPLTAEAKVLPPDMHNLKKLRLRPRLAPIPQDLLTVEAVS